MRAAPQARRMSVVRGDDVIRARVAAGDVGGLGAAGQGHGGDGQSGRSGKEGLEGHGVSLSYGDQLVKCQSGY